VDVRQHAALRDRDAAHELVQLLVVAHGQLDVARHDAVLLVVAAGVAGELEDLGRQVLEHGRQVDGRAGADAARGLRAEEEGRAGEGRREGELRCGGGARARARAGAAFRRRTFIFFM